MERHRDRAVARGGPSPDQICYASKGERTKIGIFLLVFNSMRLDYRDARAQETLFARIERTIERGFAEGH